ncbi:MAG: hypothetical protein AVDCRST_MAG30-769, partial [uncultured Solirubrobacteraceae bacterium]
EDLHRGHRRRRPHPRRSHRCSRPEAPEAPWHTGGHAHRERQPDRLLDPAQPHGRRQGREGRRRRHAAGAPLPGHRVRHRRHRDDRRQGPVHVLAASAGQHDLPRPRGDAAPRPERRAARPRQSAGRLQGQRHDAQARLPRLLRGHRPPGARRPLGLHPAQARRRLVRDGRAHQPARRRQHVLALQPPHQGQAHRHVPRPDPRAQRSRPGRQPRADPHRPL